MLIFWQMFEKTLEHEKVVNARVTAMVKHGNTKVMGYNSKKSHPFQKRFSSDPDCIYLHAEVDAIKNYLRYTRDIDSLYHSELYVMRVKRDGKSGPMVTGLSKPCKGCMRAISTFGIPKVFYTEDMASGFTCL